MGNVRILIALQAALLTLFSAGCSGAFSRPQVSAATPNFTMATLVQRGPGSIPLLVYPAGAPEVLATDAIPVIWPASSDAVEPGTRESPIKEQTIINNDLGVPHDANGEVINPFRGGQLDGFASADAISQKAPPDPPSTEINSSKTSTETILPSAPTQAESNDAATARSEKEPAPRDLPPSESTVVNAAPAEAPPDDEPSQVVIESTSNADVALPPLSGTQGPLSATLTETVIEDVPLMVPAQLDPKQAKVRPARSPEPSVSPVGSPSPVIVESKSSCDLAEPPALIAAMNFVDLHPSNSASGIDRRDTSATTTAIFPTAPPEGTEFAALTESSEATPAKVLRPVFQAEPTVVAPAAPRPLPSQTPVGISQMNKAMSPMPASVPPPLTLQIALSPDSPVTTIPRSATFSGPNGQAQALLVIRVETIPQLNVTTPIAQPATPHPSSIASELPEVPRPVQQPVAVQPNPIESSFSTDQLCVWRRTKPPTKSRDVEAPSASNRISQHLSHSLAQ